MFRRTLNLNPLSNQLTRVQLNLRQTRPTSTTFLTQTRKYRINSINCFSDPQGDHFQRNAAHFHALPTPATGERPVTLPNGQEEPTQTTDSYLNAQRLK